MRIRSSVGEASVRSESSHTDHESLKTEILEMIAKNESKSKAVLKKIDELRRLSYDTPREERQKVNDAYYETVAAYNESRKKFWRRLRSRAAAILIAFSVPHEDSHVSFGKGTFAEKEVAARQLSEAGITDYQRQGYTPVLSDTLARGFDPFGYSVEHNGSIDYQRAVEATAGGLIFDQNQAIENAYAKSVERENPPLVHAEQKFAKRTFGARIDAWRMYLGLPQKHMTFGISDSKPEKAKEDRYYYKINAFVDHIQEFQKLLGIEEPPVKYLLDRMNETVPLPKHIASAVAKSNPSYFKATKLENRSIVTDGENVIMGQYTLSKGEDAHGHYISYYDRWDLDGSLEGRDGVIGKPFEIYDRIYYDPQTFAVIEPKKS